MAVTPEHYSLPRHQSVSGARMRKPSGFWPLASGLWPLVCWPYGTGTCCLHVHACGTLHRARSIPHGADAPINISQTAVCDVTLHAYREGLREDETRYASSGRRARRNDPDNSDPRRKYIDPCMPYLVALYASLGQSRVYQFVWCLFPVPADHAFGRQVLSATVVFPHVRTVEQNN